MTTLIELAKESEYGDPGTIDAHELSGLEEYTAGASVYANEDGSCTVYLHIQESLQFHGDYGNTAAFERTDPDEEWELTEAAFQVLPSVIAERYEGENFDMAGDVISFELSLTLPGSTTVEDVAGLFWERSKVVDFINESDPGTFGSLYLFGSVINDALKGA